MLTAVSGVEHHSRVSSWAPPLPQANEALAQDTETAVVWQKARPLGPRITMLLPACDLRQVLGKGNQYLLECLQCPFTDVILTSAVKRVISQGWGDGRGDARNA